MGYKYRSRETFPNEKVALAQPAEKPNWPSGSSVVKVGDDPDKFQIFTDDDAGVQAANQDAAAAKKPPYFELNSSR